MSIIEAKTETGSVYRIDFDANTVSRVNESSGLRRDGEQLRMLSAPIVVVGLPIEFMLEPLGEGNVTIRTTSFVVSIVDVS